MAVENIVPDDPRIKDNMINHVLLHAATVSFDTLFNKAMLLNQIKMLQALRYEFSEYVDTFKVKGITAMEVSPGEQQYGDIQTVRDAIDVLTYTGMDKPKGMYELLLDDLAQGRDAGLSTAQRNLMIRCQKAVGIFLLHLINYWKYGKTNDEKYVMLGHGYFKKQQNQEYLLNHIRKFLIRFQGHRFFQVASPSVFTADHQEELRTMAVSGNMRVLRVELEDYKDHINDQVKMVSYLRNTLGAIAHKVPVKSRRNIRTVGDAINQLGALLIRISHPEQHLFALSTKDLVLLDSCQSIIQKFVESVSLRKKYPLQYYNFFKLTKNLAFYKLNIKSAMSVEKELAKRVVRALVREKQKLIIMHTVFADLTLKKGEFKTNRELEKAVYADKQFVQLLYDLNMALRALINSGTSFDQAIQAVKDQDWEAFRHIAARAKVGLTTVNEFLAQVYAKARADPDGRIAEMYADYRQQLARANLVPLDAPDKNALASINLTTAVPA